MLMSLLYIGGETAQIELGAVRHHRHLPGPAAVLSAGR
jgi:hypothetical protein